MVSDISVLLGSFGKIRMLHAAIPSRQPASDGAASPTSEGGLTKRRVEASTTPGALVVEQSYPSSATTHPEFYVLVARGPM
jgi:hypothetical protein